MDFRNIRNIRNIPHLDCTSDRQEFRNIKQSLNEFFSCKTNENLKDELCTYMINIVAEYKTNNADKKAELEITDFLEEFKDYGHPIVAENAEFIILPKTTKPHDIDLLDEIWRKIFSYLPTNDVLGKVARVCKRFYEITKDPTLLKSIKVKKFTDYDHEYIIKVLERSKCLKKLSVINCDNYKDILSVALKSNLNLKTLILCHHKSDFHPIFHSVEDKLCNEEIVRMIATNCRNLDHLYIRMPLSHAALKLIASLHQLKTLHIQNGRTIISPDIIDQIAKNYTKLESFHVQFHHFEDLTISANNGMAKLEEMKSSMKSLFQKQKTLKKLIFKCFSSSYSAGLFEAIDLSQELEHFDIGGPTDYSINKAEMEAMSRLPKLKYLALGMNPGFGMIPPIFDLSPVLNSFMTNASFDEMQYLSLNFIDLTNENLETLSGRSLPNLIGLSLNFCSPVKVNDSILTKLVKNAPNLKHLQLFDVNIEEVSDEFFYKLQMKHILVTVRPEKEKSVEKYIKYNVPSSEYPRSKLFLSSLMKKMGQLEDPTKDKFC